MTLISTLTQKLRQVRRGCIPKTMLWQMPVEMYNVAVSPTFKARLKGILLSGQSNDSYWTTAWNAFINNPTAANKSVVETRLLAFYRAIIIRPEFNLM